LAVESPVTSFSADLFGDSGGAPTNPVLVSFADPLTFPIAGCSDYILTPTSAFSLQPSTTYWLRLRGDAPGGSGDLGWCESNPDTPYSGIATSAELMRASTSRNSADHCGETSKRAVSTQRTTCGSVANRRCV